MKARDLRIVGCNSPHIVKDIHHVRFDNLEIMYLHGDKIKNIDLLSRMRLPVLTDLSLRENKIMSIAALGRMNLRNLETLDIRIYIFI